MLRNMGDSSIWGLPGSRLLATGTNDPDTHTHTHTPHTMSDLTPQQIRDEFASLWQDQVIGKEYLLRALSNYVNTDILAEFMDDLANGRV
jgi:hypothetical protein